MVILRYGFDNPNTIKDIHRYLYHEKRFHSFEDAKKFINDLPNTITLKLFDYGQEFVTELETNCYILCEGRRIPQIKGKLYEVFEYYNSNYKNFAEKFYESRNIDFNLRSKKYDYENNNWFLDKFIKR